MQEMITLEDAQTHLAEIIAALTPGKELVITQNERLVAKLVGQEPPARLPRKPGSAVGRLIIHAEDDKHLADFAEYLSADTAFDNYSMNRLW